jgi:hypothetical protein
MEEICVTSGVRGRLACGVGADLLKATKKADHVLILVFMKIVKGFLTILPRPEETFPKERLGCYEGNLNEQMSTWRHPKPP